MKGEEAGASLELALGMALLVIPALIAVLSFSPWLEARAFVRTAAAEGARAAVLADGDPAAAGAALVADMAIGRGWDGVEVEMCGGGGCVLERGGFVTARVTVEVPLVSTPWGDVGGLTVEATHAEPVDFYRSLP
ncbi:MAG: hypothetical protein ACLFWM_04725 [Actinomycetota bacterium]